MRNAIRLSAAAPAALLVLVALAACGAGPAPAGKPGTITVAASDTACAVGASQIAAGTATFSITNGGTKVTEFYVYAPGDRIMAEVENIVPGLTRELVAELPAGSYETACKPGMSGKGIRNALKVTGEHKPLTADAELAEATRSYQRYVRTQTDALLVKTREFADAVKAGDLDKGKELYPVARTYWERIEPVAEIFGDLDPAIDGREADLAPGQKWTGFHRIEKDLWITKDVSKDGPVADKLLADVRTIVARANATTLTPLNLANGAKELLDEVATGKITGEEDIWSHTDLWDFAANLEGSQAAVQALRPVLEERAPDLVRTLDERFAAATAALAAHRRGDGWQSHDELSKAQLKALSDAINALGEPISKIAPIVAK